MSAFKRRWLLLLVVLLPSCKGGGAGTPWFGTDGGGDSGAVDGNQKPDAAPRWDAGRFDAGGRPDAATPPDEAPHPCGSLASRVRVTAVDISPAMVTVGQYGPFSENRPIFLSTLADGSSAVAWADTSGQVHITPLGRDDRRAGADITLPGIEVRGFVAHSDGGAVLVRRDDVMALVRVDNAGTVLFDRPIVGGQSHEVEGAKWIDSWSHEGRLRWSGNEYAAYFGHTGNWGASGNHQGDILHMFDSSGNTAGWGWTWGCSHSLDVRLSHNGAVFGPVCLSDCYPAKGIVYNHSSLIFADDSGSCSGYINTTLGGLVPAQGGFQFSFVSPKGRSSPDVALVFISDQGTPGPVHWLTDTPAVQEHAAQLALYGNNLLAAWISGSQYVAAVVDASGNMLEGPEPLNALFAERDDFANFPNGDVGWAFAWDNMSELKIVRLSYCQ